MARKKTHDSEKPGGPLPTNGIGHNSSEAVGPDEMSEDERQYRFFEYRRKWAEAKEALAIVQAEAKSCLGKHAIRDFRLAAALDTPEGEAKVKEKRDAEARIARWLGVSVGTQAEMFDRTPGVEKAEADGYRACMKDEPRSPPHDPSVPQYESWMTGYDAAQAVIASGFKKLHADHTQGM